MESLRQIIASEAVLPDNSYIYRIISTAPRQDPLTYSLTDQLATISSDDSLRFYTADLRPDGEVYSANESITCLERADDASSNVVTTAGRDGFIRFWDKRSKQKVLEIQSPHKLISALTCSTTTNILAAGIENPEDGPNSSPVYIWEPRSPTTPLRSYPDSHTDTVTTLSLHPSHPTLLLSSSTDGLINIFDTTQADEDDALYQVINHGSAIAHAGFMYPSTDIYAIGTDETVSFHALQSQEEEVEEPSPRVWGDVREGVGCDEAKLSLIPITKGPNGPLDYPLDAASGIQMDGAHGEEIVRDFFTDVHTQVTYTVGEDGMIRAWKNRAAGDEGSGKRRGKEKKDKEKARFKPY
ncbi:WD40 domain containing protein [Pyrenophora teres f. maculata]|nr:WD40 domain containing protein [Pyrenophora teres f. maculata]